MKDNYAYDPAKAQEQAEILYNAGKWLNNHGFIWCGCIWILKIVWIGEGKVGTDENAFVEILGHAGQRHAYLIFQEYKKISGKTIEQAMESEMSGELLAGLLAIGTFYVCNKHKMCLLTLKFNTIDYILAVNSQDRSQPTSLLCWTPGSCHEGIGHGWWRFDPHYRQPLWNRSCQYQIRIRAHQRQNAFKCSQGKHIFLSLLLFLLLFGHLSKVMYMNKP